MSETTDDMILGEPEPWYSDAEKAAYLTPSNLIIHDYHEKEQIGPCVYCITCNERLYQGKL